MTSREFARRLADLEGALSILSREAETLAAVADEQRGGKRGTHRDPSARDALRTLAAEMGKVQAAAATLHARRNHLHRETGELGED